MIKLDKKSKWIVCSVCRNDKKNYPDGCRFCKDSGNPGYVLVKADNSLKIIKK